MLEKSGLLKLNLGDLGKGLVLVLLLAGLEGVSAVFKVNGLDVSLDNFSPVLDMLVKCGAAYLLKNVFSAENGKFVGRIG